MNPIELNLFVSRVSAICEEMGVVLRRTAFSPNIKDRLDFSCALFDRHGELFAQAAHIPVHLGSMAYAMRGIVGERDWRAGDMLVLNDPYLGGTHLPDVTVIAPVFTADATALIGFAANRAHHANIGCDTPGSMPLSTTLAEEGIVIPPTWLLREGELQQHGIELPDMQGGRLSGDIAAQVGANQVGIARLQELVSRTGSKKFEQGVDEMNAYGDRLMAAAIEQLQPGEYSFADVLDDDGLGTTDIKLAVTLRITTETVSMDFRDSAAQVRGNLNCPESVVAAAAYYCLRCLLPAEAPACAGLFRRVQLLTQRGSILNAERPAAVAAGNVETSMRLVDLVFGALAQALPARIPAASQGTMNNVAMGYIDTANGDTANGGTTNGYTPNGTRWDYYETLAGGIGGGPRYAGADAMHSHMTNTLNTPVESLEMHYPLRVTRYAVRIASGGAGLHPGGCGIIREYEFLAPAQCSLLTERRRVPPWGLNGGAAGACGSNSLNGKPLPAKCTVAVTKGDRLCIETPGGGGWGTGVIGTGETGSRAY